MNHPNHTEDVGVEGLLHLGRRDFESRAAYEDARVVDQNVEPTMPALKVPGERGDALIARNVELDRNYVQALGDKLVRGLFTSSPITTREVDAQSTPAELPGDLFAKALICP
jgi:hypothetical protein